MYTRARAFPEAIRARVTEGCKRVGYDFETDLFITDNTCVAPRAPHAARTPHARMSALARPARVRYLTRPPRVEIPAHLVLQVQAAAPAAEGGPGGGHREEDCE